LPRQTAVLRIWQSSVLVCSEQSSSFSKKGTKKLLLSWLLLPDRTAIALQTSFASFLQKKALFAIDYVEHGNNRVLLLTEAISDQPHCIFMLIRRKGVVQSGPAVWD
jgi:hypothetical protein